MHLAQASELDLEPVEPRRAAVPANGAARIGSISTLARAVDARDAYSGSHSERVSELAARISEQLALTHAEVELARLAGRLHDLGKLAVPREILRKEGPLSAAERRVLERHTEIGSRMVESIGLSAAAPWVLHHHERWDGTGYPDQLHGEEIPLGARIIFVAGAYDSMTSEAVYRAASESGRSAGRGAVRRGNAIRSGRRPRAHGRSRSIRLTGRRRLGAGLGWRVLVSA